MIADPAGVPFVQPVMLGHEPAEGRGMVWAAVGEGVWRSAPAIVVEAAGSPASAQCCRPRRVACKLQHTAPPPEGGCCRRRRAFCKAQPRHAAPGGKPHTLTPQRQVYCIIGACLQPNTEGAPVRCLNRANYLQNDSQPLTGGKGNFFAPTASDCQYNTADGGCGWVWGRYVAHGTAPHRPGCSSTIAPPPSPRPAPTGPSKRQHHQRQWQNTQPAEPVRASQ